MEFADDRVPRRRPARYQPQHGVEGVPRARARRSRRGSSRRRHLRDPDPHRQHPGRARPAPGRSRALAREGPARRAGRGQHRGALRQHLSVRAEGGDGMSTVLRSAGLGKKYRRNWALSDCTLEVPAGRVVGLVGPNGAGKSTLLNLAVGMLAPTTGSIRVLGDVPGRGPEELGRVGFVAQDTPTYPALSVADHLRLGAHLNPGWDAALADARIDELG